MTKKNVAEQIFKGNPKIQEVFITSDKRAFMEQGQADAYAQRLTDRKVVKIDRDLLDDEIDVTPAGAADTIKDTTAAVGGAPVITLENGGSGEATGEADTDKKLEDMNFEELKAVATDEEVNFDEIEGQLSKAKLIEAITKKRAEKEELDFSEMTPEQLVAYGKETFDLELNAEAPKEELIELLNDHIKAIQVNE